MLYVNVFREIIAFYFVNTLLYETERRGNRQVHKFGIAIIPSFNDHFCYVILVEGKKEKKSHDILKFIVFSHFLDFYKILFYTICTL